MSSNQLKVEGKLKARDPLKAYASFDVEGAASRSWKETESDLILFYSWSKLLKLKKSGMQRIHNEGVTVERKLKRTLFFSRAEEICRNWKEPTILLGNGVTNMRRKHMIPSLQMRLSCFFKGTPVLLDARRTSFLFPSRPLYYTWSRKIHDSLQSKLFHLSVFFNLSLCFDYLHCLLRFMFVGAVLDSRDRKSISRWFKKCRKLIKKV